MTLPVFAYPKTSCMNKPVKVVIFDLDFTLWDAGGLWCDCTHPPYQLTPNGQVYDSVGREIRLYADTLEVLQLLHYKKVPLALASRTGEPDWANQLTRMLGIDPFISYREIYPGSKTTHLTKIQGITGVDFAEMLFFDDEHRNIADASSLGVRAVLVQSGINKNLVLGAFAQNTVG
jgi:magnesium-dependent phosphatase 1